MKTVLIQCPAWGVFEPPVGLAQISACLKKAGHEVKVFDLNIELYSRRIGKYKNVWAMEQCHFWNNAVLLDDFFLDNFRLLDKAADDIVGFAPAVIAFSLSSVCWMSAQKFVRMIKKKYRNFISVLGGPLFNEKGRQRELLNDFDFDIVIEGEGENTMVELFEKIENRKDIKGCPGLYCRDKGKIIYTGKRSFIKDLDSLPFLDFWSFPVEKYDPPGHRKKNLSLNTSRGCIWGCAFCSSKSYWKRGFCQMSGRRIYEEVMFHLSKDRDINHIEFLDLLFNGNMESVREFCNLFSEWRKKCRRRVEWHANAIIRPEMTEKVCAKMKAAGCERLTFGIESGSQKILNLMGKKYRIEQAPTVLKAVSDSGIKITCNFMFGFPGETEDDFQKTLDFITGNAEYIDIVYPSRTFCGLEEGSYLRKHPEEFGIKPDFKHSLYWQSKDGKNTYPVRRQKCERFSRLAEKLKLYVGEGLQTSIEMDKWYSLGAYYDSCGNLEKAAECYRNYMRLDPDNIEARLKLNKYRQSER